MSLVINNNLMAANTARTLNGHYGRLAQSTERLSSGLRINSAADDAAGLAIRELYRAEIAALHQGARNANDAISLIQTADGALSVIDEKLIRMKELAEQAATGTYDSTQRLMIASEFVAMGSEINRIANATDFNGIKLLDGSLQGAHDGSGLDAKGALKVHFGSSNSSMEDYYYLDIKDSSLLGLGLATPIIQPASPPNSIGNVLGQYNEGIFNSGIVPIAYIPAGSKNITIEINCYTQDDDIQIFTRSGLHILGTQISNTPADNDFTWATNDINGTADASKFLTESNGFDNGATYELLARSNAVYDGEFLDGAAADPDADTFDGKDPTKTMNLKHNATGEYMNIAYTRDFDWRDDDINDGYVPYDGNSYNGDEKFRNRETVTIDNVTEDLVVIVSGHGSFGMRWRGFPVIDPVPPVNEDVVVGSVPHSIETQEAAQHMLDKIDAAIVKKDKIRAHLGAMQNRLENTISNLNIQAENLQAAESRISDVDVATEMTEFVRNQILTQSAVAMLSQANSLPQMAMQLIGG